MVLTEEMIKNLPLITEEELKEIMYCSHCFKKIHIIEKAYEAERDSKMLQESTRPKFNSIEETRQFYNAIPFSEWEKIFDEYGIKW